MYRIPDRIRLFAAVALTAPLPHGLRVAVRDKWLRSQHMRKTRAADFIIINHPKSGGTWLRVMLSRLYHVRYGLPPRRLVKSDEFYNLDRGLPRFLVSNGYYTYESVVQDVLDELGPGAGGKKLVLLARNPLDLAVSWHIQLTKRTSAYKRELINSTLENPIDKDRITRWEFTQHEGVGLPAVIDFHNLWQRRLAGCDTGLVIRYEDLRSEPVETMVRLCGYLDTPFDRAEIEHAVEFAAFDNMRKLEESNYFRNSSMAPNKGEGPKVRRGKVGGYRDYYNAEQIAAMEAMVAERLTPELGYSQPPAAAMNGAERS
jgi:hypothetical protein